MGNGVTFGQGQVAAKPENIEGRSGSVNGGTLGVQLLGWVLCGALMMCPRPMAMAQSGEEICYVALGDSVSSGYGLEEEAQRFTQQVAGENGFELTSLAQNGETSQTLLERLQDPDVLQAVAQADVMTVTIGGNDLMQALYEYLAQRYCASHSDAGLTREDMQQTLMGGDMSMLTFALGEIPGFSASQEEQKALCQLTENLTQVVTEIQTVNPRVYLVVVNQYNPYRYLLQEFSKYPPLARAAQDIEETLEDGVSALNAAIATVGAQMGYSVADVYTAFEQARENPCNAAVSAFAKVNLDFHPNAYGHSLIAQVVGEATKPPRWNAGKHVQTVSGATTTMVQSREGKDDWRWEIVVCVAGLALIGILAWRRSCYNKAG